MKYILLTILTAMIVMSSQATQAQTMTSIPVYPNTINVLFVQRDTSGKPIFDPDTGQYVPVGPQPNPRPVAFEGEYLPNVVRVEMTNDANMPAKEVQAVAARSYAWHKIAYPDDDRNALHPCFVNRTCTVTNSLDDQYYDPGTAGSADVAAVQNTSKLFLAFSNQGAVSNVVAFTQYGKSHIGTYTVAFDIQNSPYLDRVYDPIIDGSEPGVDNDPVKAGQGIGMAQDGALRWERGNDFLNGTGTRYPFWNRDQILAHYYTSVQLRHPNGDLYWGDYRWNMLQLYPTNPGTLYYENEARIVSMDVQNSGVKAWPANTTLWYKWRRRTNATGQMYELGWYQAQTTTGGIVTAPQLPVGREETLRDIQVTLPSGLYLAAGGYTYSIVWDLRRNQQFFASDGYGWHPQEIGIKPRKRVAAPTPKTPPCQGPNPCAQNIGIATAEWLPVSHPDAVQYQWRHQTGSGSTTGTTSATSINRSLAVGSKEIYVATKDTTEATNTSGEILVYRALYDPVAPTLTIQTSLPQWTNAQSLNLVWSGNDTLSGVRDYAVEQQINGGAWTTIMAPSAATQFSTAVLNNNTTYTFRITVRDHAGNLSQQTLFTTIDRDPPSSLLTAPTGALAKTWAVLRWTSSADRAPITSYSIEQQIGGMWQAWRTVSGIQSMLFIGQPNTVYAFRIRASDAAGNIETTHVLRDITFTTGNDSSGLYRQYLPTILKESSGSSSTPRPIDPYPLPTSP